MKLIFSMLLMLVAAGLSGQQLQDVKDIQKIEFSTLSRAGHYEEIVITKNELQFQKEKRRSGEEKQTHSRVIDEMQWKGVLQNVEHLNLHEIPKLQSPSMDRAFDGARHSAIVITTFDNQQYIHRFDDENPNERLKPLLESVLELHDLLSN